MIRVTDNALPAEVFAEVSRDCLENLQGEYECSPEVRSSVEEYILPLANQLLGSVKLVACFSVSTVASGSRPHLDHGQHAAVLHLNEEWSLAWGGEFFAVAEDKETIQHAVEFRPNRLVVWDRHQMHCHRPPTHSASSRPRVALVMRFEDAL